MRFISGVDPDELAAAVLAWLQLFDLGEHPTSVTMPWLTWEESAQQLLGEIAE